MTINLLYKDEVFAIIGASIDVHKVLEPDFLESVYEEAMVVESTKREIPFQTQVKILVIYKGSKLNKEFIAEYIGYEKIIDEFNCIPKLTKVEEAQIINYLNAAQLKVGLLINFGSNEKFEWKGYVYTK